MGRLIFVYGTLKRGFWNSVLLKRAKFVDEGVTLDRFKLYSIGYPYAVPDENGLPIKGEVYEIDEKTLSEIDNLEGYPLHYKRKPVRVKLRGEDEVEALIYYGEEPTGTPIPPKGGFYIWEGE